MVLTLFIRTLLSQLRFSRPDDLRFIDRTAKCLASPDDPNLYGLTQ